MGELRLGRKDDGTLEVLQADDEIEIDANVYDDIPTEGDYRLEGNVLKIDASGEFLAYAIVGYDRLLNVWRAVRTADRPGR